MDSEVKISETGYSKGELFLNDICQTKSFNRGRCPFHRRHHACYFDGVIYRRYYFSLITLVEKGEDEKLQNDYPDIKIEQSSN